MIMTFKDQVYCRVLSTDEKLSTTYYVNVLCGDVSGNVDVHSFGIAGACGQEFSFYFPDWEGKLLSGTQEEKYLAMALSANNGWGHANDRCFTPHGTTDDRFIEVQ